MGPRSFSKECLLFSECLNLGFESLHSREFSWKIGAELAILSVAQVSGILKKLATRLEARNI
jgi:hypothetical protein